MNRLRDELRAVSRQLEERFVHQLQVQIAAADVDDECHPRLKRGDVGEILFGADAEEHAVTASRVRDLRNDVAVQQLIGDEVVGAIEAVALGEFLGQAPKSSLTASPEPVKGRQFPQATPMRQ